MNKLKCEKCGKGFDRGNYKTKKFCSNECCVKSHNERIVKAKSEAIKNRTPIICICSCGKEFIKTYRRKYCGPECGKAYWKAETKRVRDAQLVKPEVACPRCGVIYIQQRKTQGFCSKTCKNYRPPRVNKYTKETQENRRLIKAYGITIEEFNGMVLEQDGRCAICRDEFKSRKGTHIDHSHGSDKQVRGVLCTCCNIGLGMFKDNETRLSAALAYLKSSWREYRESVEAADAALEAELW